jgi:hypothetical protein
METTSFVRVACAVLAVVFLGVIIMRRKGKESDE